MGNGRTPAPPRASAPITFVVPAGVAAGPAGTRDVRIAPGLRAADAPVARVQAVPGRDVVELTLRAPDGQSLTLTLSPEAARDLLLSQAGAQATRSAAATAAGEVVVPAHAAWVLPPAATRAAGTERSLAGDLLFQALKVIGFDPGAKAAEQFRKWRDWKVDEGVYRLGRQPPGSLLDAPKLALMDAVDHPQLVLVHGTFVDTQSTFGGWWERHLGLVNTLFDSYRDQVYALDHRTLGASPIANALTLLQAAPPNARLHLVTHSRGGLVAEVLVRACSEQGITAADEAFFGQPDYAGHLEELRRVARQAKERKVRIERVVRIACPAHGTHLASGRLDAYFSVLSWMLEKAGAPLLPQALDFLRDVAGHRRQPDEFPGLEAMMPEHPLARWVASPARVRGDLRVVAGDTEPDLLESWVRALLAYALLPVFLEDNDLVVHTASMYGGASREGGILFRLFRGARLDHTGYFRHEEAGQAIGEALLADQPERFQRVGAQSQAGQSSTGVRAVTPGRPVVILLPGIMGSHLRAPGGEREWLVGSRMLGLLDRIRRSVALEPDGPLEETYQALIEFLRATHDVVPFSYDWRAPIADAADALAAIVRRELDAREASVPVRLLAHSMGSLVARQLQVAHADVWSALMARPGARFVMLGPPNHGSWAPMQVLTGDDRLTRTLAMFGGSLRDRWARERFAEFEGLLQMQAALDDPRHGLAARQRWQDYAELDKRLFIAQSAWHDPKGLADFYEWALPAQEVLDRAKAFWTGLAGQAAVLGDDAGRMAIVLGTARRTPCGLGTEGDVAYEFTSEGDGRVTWASSALPGVRMWRAPAVHGDLPAHRDAFAAYLQLLQDGQTTQLPAHEGGATRGAGAPALPRSVASGRLRGAAGVAEPLEAEIARLAMGGDLGALPAGRAARAGARLKVQVVHGDVRFIPQPLLVGHSSALELTGSESVVNQLLGGAMADALAAGLYPDKPGEHLVFHNQHPDAENPWGVPRPKAVVVVGLGRDSDLRGPELRETVRRGVLGYLRQEAEQRRQARPEGQREGVDGAPVVLAMTSLGSGGNLSVAESVSHAIAGVIEANLHVPEEGGVPRWPRVGEVRFIELYGNRAAEAWHSLNNAARTLAGLDLVPGVQPDHGGRTRPVDVNYRGVSHDLVRVTLQQEVRPEAHLPRMGDVRKVGSVLPEPGARGDRAMAVIDTLEFSLFTRRARSEIRAKGTQRPMVDALVAAAENQTHTDADLGRALYQLLVPLELRAHLGGGSSLMLELQPETARYPWEMLDDAVGNGRAVPQRPLALRMNFLLRRLAISEFRRNPMESTVEDILLVGMSEVPTFGGQPLPSLPGVRHEIERVQQVLAGRGHPATVLVDRPFLDVVKPALIRPWKVMHFSGHGIYDPALVSGMIMTDTTVFGPPEFESRDWVPELVFINCCHLGKTERMLPRGTFAANVAEQLVRIGVRCVVAAGWAVDDTAAAEFAAVFYQALLEGRTFATAVQLAREAAWQANPGCNTWAAYQCYGDASWRLRPSGEADRAARDSGPPPEFATVEELLARLEEMDVGGQALGEEQRKRQRAQLRQLLQTPGPVAGWLQQGRVAEAVARAWSSLGQLDEAEAWFERATLANDASASLRAREQLLNLRARNATQLARIDDAIRQIGALLELAKTPERFSLLGSAHKRRAMLAKERAEQEKSLAEMASAYAQAKKLDADNAFYPAVQRMLALLRLAWLGQGKAPGAKAFRELDELLARRESARADFWTAVARHEIDLYEALVNGQLANRRNGLAASFADVHARISNPSRWRSVLDTANFVLRAHAERDPPPDPAEVQAGRQLLKQLAQYAK